MKAVVLVAGEGTRLRPFTYSKPKPLLKIANKPILEHNLEQLVGLISEVIIVVGAKSEKIKNHFGNNFKGIKIIYVEQKQQLGTGHALLQAKKYLKGRFLVMYGDDLHNREDIKKCLSSECILAKKVDDCSRFGMLCVKNNKLKNIIEKPKKSSSGLVNTGLYVLNEKIFIEIEKLKKSSRKEFELTDAIKNQNLDCVISEHWMPVAYPWDLLRGNEEILKRQVKKISKKAIVERNTTVKGEVKIGDGTIIKNGCYIEGPCAIGKNSVIGPNCYVRAYSTIGDNCKIGNAVEIKNSIIGNDTNIGHLSYVGDSVIGDNCNLGAGTVTANLRHDNQSIRVSVRGKLIDSKERKMGVFMADYSKTGINTSLYPGIYLGPFSWTAPAIEVKKDVEPFYLDLGNKKKRIKTEIIKKMI